MPSVAFLEALAIVSMTLGSVVGVVVGVLPLLLPKALTSIQKDVLAARRNPHKKKARAKRTLLSKFHEFFVSTPLEDLESERSGMRTSIRNGMFSALSFFSCGLVCLGFLLLPYTVIDGVPYVFISDFGRVVLAGPFVLGVIFLLALAGSSYSTMRHAVGFE